MARSSAEAEYRAMAHTACEMMWVKNIFQEDELHYVWPHEDVL